ncbi:unnamed protein product [Rotaria sp. Silwood2]|nr:unnamed protein product [Rotaria sp. Silwood2]CAF4069056.1 unnamed protein product [Rotaria sp. Silwood2]
MADQINQAIDIVIPWMEYENDGNDDDDEHMEKIISLSDCKGNGRPLYQITRKKYFEIIRQQLQANNRILFIAYNTYAYYSCEKNELQQKVHEHMTRPGIYRLIMELNDTNQHHIEEVLNKMDNEITTKLNLLFDDKLISHAQWQKLSMYRLNTRLNTLYFLPDTRRDHVPFHPMIYDRHHLTMNITRFLTRLLQPIYDDVTFSTTCNRGTDVIHVVEEYARKGRLQANTLFATLRIDNLSTLISHEKILEKLQHFLHTYLFDGKMEGITVPTILDLLQLVLENQYLLYEKKIYQQTQGCGDNSPLTMLIVNIYLYYWQQDLMTILNNKKEIFARCFDELFFTWNESEQSLHDILHTMNRQNPQIQIILSMSNNINYLDVNISHMDGDLKTQVVHQLNIDSYSLPYVFGHPRKKIHTLFRAALLRATRCYAKVSDFATELQRIQSSFQYNRFSHDFIMYKIISFFEEFDVFQMKVHYGEKFYDQRLYDHLRRKVFKYQRQQKAEKIKRRRQILKHRYRHSLNQPR